MNQRQMVFAALIALLAVPPLSGCRDGQGTASAGDPFGLASRPRVESGTQLSIRLVSTIDSETARVGDPWTGVVIHAVTDRERVIVPAGSEVRGTVSGAHGARRGSRAMLDLVVKEVVVDGRSHPLVAGTDAVIAGSPRARNLGAIAGGAAAGALIGKAIGGDGKDAAIGGLIGGAAATGVVARSKGYQVVL
jgi:hypothetical protein